MLATVLRTGQVLSLFGPQRPECTLTEVAEALGLPRSTVHALLKTLCAVGLLRRTPSRRYALGPKLHALAVPLAATDPAVRAAQGAAEELARRWGGVARVLVAGFGWAPAEVFRAEGAEASLRAGAPPHRCFAVAAAAKARAGDGPWCDVERTRPGCCCVAVCAADCDAARLVVDLCLPAARFYPHAETIQASVLSACGKPNRPLARAEALVPKPLVRRQLAR